MLCPRSQAPLFAIIAANKPSVQMCEYVCVCVCACAVSVRFIDIQRLVSVWVFVLVRARSRDRWKIDCASPQQFGKLKKYTPGIFSHHSCVSIRASRRLHNALECSRTSSSPKSSSSDTLGTLRSRLGLCSGCHWQHSSPAWRWNAWHM